MPDTWKGNLLFHNFGIRLLKNRNFKFIFLKVFPKDVAMILIYLKDLDSEIEYFYALANDKANYLRSSDLGNSWKYVSSTEHTRVCFLDRIFR